MHTTQVLAKYVKKQLNTYRKYLGILVAYVESLWQE